MTLKILKTMKYMNKIKIIMKVWNITNSHLSNNNLLKMNMMNNKKKKSMKNMFKMKINKKKKLNVKFNINKIILKKNISVCLGKS